MKKQINENLAEIIETAYKKGFEDAIELYDDPSRDLTMDEALEEGINKTRKQWGLPIKK